METLQIDCLILNYLLIEEALMDKTSYFISIRDKKRQEA